MYTYTIKQTQTYRQVCMYMYTNRYTQANVKISEMIVLTFISLYIVSFQFSENARKRFRYPDAPKIDMRDPAMSVLEQTGQIDLIGLKRLATVQMTNAAMDAIDGGATPKVKNSKSIINFICLTFVQDIILLNVFFQFFSWC